MTRHRSRWFAGAAGLLLLAAAAPAQSPPAGAPAWPFELTRAGIVTAASCTLLARDDDGRVVLYFATAARLFSDAAGERVAPLSSVVIDPAGRRMVIRPDDVILPPSTLVDLALLRATVETSDLVAAPLSFDPPSVDAPFVITARRGDGSPVEIRQHVRFMSTLLLIGDRDASQLPGCIGTAALGSRGIFGIVTRCDAGKAPLVTLLGPARGFLERHLSRLRPTRTSSRTFLRSTARSGDLAVRLRSLPMARAF